MKQNEFSVTKAITIASLTAGLLMAVNSLLSDGPEPQIQAAPTPTSLAAKN